MSLNTNTFSLVLPPRPVIRAILAHCEHHNRVAGQERGRDWGPCRRAVVTPGMLPKSFLEQRNLR